MTPKRRLWLAAAGLAALALIALSAALAARRTLAERAVRAWLAGQGVAPVALEIAALGLRGARLRGVALGAPEAPDLAIEELALDWSGGGLRVWRLDGLRIRGAVLRARIDSDGVHLGALDPLLRRAPDAREPAEPAGPALVLPVRDLELRDVSLELDTPQGPALGTLAARVRAEPDGAVHGDFELALRDGRTPARIAPADLRARAQGSLSALDLQLALDGAAKRLHAEASGRLDVLSRSGTLRLALAPLVLEPGVLEPKTLLPAIQPLLERFGLADAVGRLEGRGTLELSEGAPALRFDLALRGLGIRSDSWSVKGLSGKVGLRWPPFRTPDGQLVSVEVLDIGIPLTDGFVDFQLQPGGVLALRTAVWRWADGELRARDVRLDFGAATSELRLEAVDLDLAKLFTLVSLEGLSGSGRLEGELPLVRNGSEWKVSKGVLRARPPGGRLRFAPNLSVRALAESRPNDLGLAIHAFEDFRFEALEARLDGDLRGEMALGLHVRGANPKFERGQPIELNLNLDAHLADLVRAGTSVYRVPEAVERRLRGFEKDEEKDGR